MTQAQCQKAGRALRRRRDAEGKGQGGGGEKGEGKGGCCILVLSLCSPKATVHELLLCSGGEEVLQEGFSCSASLRLLAVNVLIHNRHWKLNLRFAM